MNTGSIYDELSTAYRCTHMYITRTYSLNVMPVRKSFFTQRIIHVLYVVHTYHIYVERRVAAPVIIVVVR